MDKQRIQVYADRETKRRIELAAAKYDVSVTEYCLSAIRQRLGDDDLLERERVEIEINPDVRSDGLTDALSTLHERVLSRREGRPIDVNIVDQVRGERDVELTGLR